MPPEKLIIDTDPATGLPLKDVDDGLAVLYLFAQPERFEVLAVTPVFGNAPLSRTVPKTHELLRVARRTDVPAPPGARGKRELGRPTAASSCLREAVCEHPGEVTVLALGPLTNVATAGLTDPAFYRDVKRVVAMGGALEKGLGPASLPPFEFNLFKDPAAAALVLAAPCEKVLVTTDLCMQAVFTRQELDALYRMETRVATWLALRIEPWLKLNQRAPFLPWTGGFVPWDVVAAVYLARPELFTADLVRGMRLRRGRMPTGALEPDVESDGHPCTVPMQLDGDALLDEFLAAIARHR